MNKVLPSVPVHGHRTTIVIRHIPRTALASDVRRLLAKHRVENVKNVYLDHNRFHPIGKAYITFIHPGHVEPAFALLRNAQISGFTVDLATTGPLQDLPGRTRGADGRREAMNRGILTGNGPDAGVRDRGKSVVIWGLPGKLTSEGLREHLKEVRLAGSADIKEDIVKIEPDGRPSYTSRHYVRTLSISEAHRLVRHFHMTPYSRGGPVEYMMRARVVY
ncbi:hypothetical protein K439DRAFT_1627841 [Ramaria rubella]|nr:hypothetical protein K439DRAFT_1627841 [Ramaria rubella]